MSAILISLKKQDLSRVLLSKPVAMSKPKDLDRSCFLSDIKMADNMCVVHKPKTLDCIKILVGQ